MRVMSVCRARGAVPRWEVEAPRRLGARPFVGVEGGVGSRQAWAQQERSAARQVGSGLPGEFLTSEVCDS